jgi:hypothetical protein
MYLKDEQGNKIKDNDGKTCWIDNALIDNLEFVKSKVQHKVSHRRSDLFVIFDGPVGSGKTTLSFSIARHLDPTFCLRRVVFSVDDFLEALIEAKPGQVVVFDEAIIVNSRSALTDFNKKVIIAMTQIRSKGLYIFFNIPSVFDLDRNLVLNRCHLLLHCFQDKFGDRGKYTVFDKDKLKLLYLKGKRLYSYGFPKANFVGNFLDFFPLDRKDYEKKKQLEISRQARGDKLKKKDSQMLNVLIWFYKNRERVFPGLKKKEIYEEMAKIIKDISPWSIQTKLKWWRADIRKEIEKDEEDEEENE